MAIAATTVWEVRTSGDVNNGGGYSSGGTDYSQQDAAQLTLTDGATSGAGATTLTSATGGFTSAMVGNVLYISAGTNFQTGYYQITTYTDGNNVVLDRTPSSGGAGSNGNFKVGGATNHPNTISASVVAGNTIYIAGGTYNEVGANDYVMTITVSGATTPTAVSWIGYESGTSRTTATGTNRPLFDATGVTQAVSGSATQNFFKNLRFANATGSGITCPGYFENCKSSSNGGAGWGTSCYLFNCEANSNTSYGVGQNATTSYHIDFCYLHDNSSSGFECSSTGGNSTVFGSIADSNSGYGFRCAGGQANLMLNVSYNNTGTGKDGFEMTEANNSSSAVPFINNISMSNGAYGFDLRDKGSHVFNYNCYYNNASGGVTGISAGANDVTSDPSFTDAANGDFSLGSSSPCKNAGFPGSSMAGATV